MSTEFKDLARAILELFIGIIGSLVLIAVAAVFAGYLFGITKAISEIGYRHALSLFAS